MMNLHPRIIITSTMVLLTALSACGPSGKSVATAESKNTVTPVNTKDVHYLREEEKLARDVYLALFERWNLPIFDHIGSSEQRHLDIATQHAKQSGADAAYRDEPGVFQNESLQNLYTDLVGKGSASIEAALEVGATIEDLDIRDLDEMITNTSDPQLRSSLSVLLCASGNHMRAFTSQLENRGRTYNPQFVSQTRLDVVLATAHQRCGQMEQMGGMAGHSMSSQHQMPGHRGGDTTANQDGRDSGRDSGKGDDGHARGHEGNNVTQVVELPVKGAGTKDKEISVILETKRLKIATITLRNGTVMASHAAPVPVTLQSLSGSGVVRIGNVDRVLSPGVLMWLPANEEHVVIPADRTDFVILVHHVKGQGAKGRGNRGAKGRGQGPMGRGQGPMGHGH